MTYSAVLDMPKRYATLLCMSSIHRQKGRRNWFCAFTDAKGTRHFRSTGTTDKREAREICSIWERTAREAAPGKLTQERARQIIARGVGDIMATSDNALPSTTIEAFFKAWLERKSLEGADRTHERYSPVVAQLLAFLGPKAKRDLVQLTSADLVEFRDHLSKRLAANTTNISVKIVRIALTQAKKDGLIDTNQADRVSLLKRERGGDRRPFTLDELKRILAVAKDQWRGMILVGLYTGLRLGDIASLTWENLDLARAEICLETSKTGRRQQIPLADPLIRHFQARPSVDDPTAPVFPDAFAMKQRNRAGGSLSNQFYGILVAAGLAKARTHKSTGKGRDVARDTASLSFHCLRHTATSLLKNAGVSDSVSMDIIGHESAAISRNYTHIDDPTKRAAVNKMPDVTKD